MDFFKRLFIPLFVVLAGTGGWLLVEHERDTIFAIDRGEAVPDGPGTLATAAGPDGLRPATVPAPAAREQFARAFDRSDKRPRVAIIVTGLGLAREASFRALEEMPADVTLAFSPYAENPAPLLARARDKGHEIMLAVPMEPADLKRRDAGPEALSVSHSEGATRQRLAMLLGRVPGNVGIIGDLGDRFARDPVAMRPVFEELAARGMLYVENRLESPASATPANGVPKASVSIWLDHDLSAAAIDREIAAAEAAARQTGSVVVLARAYPVSLARLAAWLRTIDRKGIAVAPVSAVAKGGT